MMAGRRSCSSSVSKGSAVFLRRYERRSGGRKRTYWALAESIRTKRGSRQRVVAYLGKFTHADAGQMHLYLNYAREHWSHEHENPPVGLILCAQKNEAVAHYALEGLPNKVLATEYRMTLPDEQVLVAELKRTQKLLQTHKVAAPKQEP
jgi:hypothetical protein